ncbi:probable GPI-anchored adhesin-like protein PGA55 [Patiria miniata]|uniref:Uncharacterized protein n=1 Tax=Patiria miniata TaxID=46514 RepID=A0A913ZD64_PATMI|nr:probable GPI-anchored adhesin-like protein PGA55 [Patiria miniata]
MSVTVPVNISAPIGPYPIIYNTPRSMEPKTPPKPLPKRKPEFQGMHIYDRVPLEGSLFKRSYSPVMYPKRPIPAPPGKLVPSLLNILAVSTQRKDPEKTCEKQIPTPPEKPVLAPPDKVTTPGSPKQAVRSENKPILPIKDKAKRQGCPNLEEQVVIKPSPEVEMLKEEVTKQTSPQQESPVCEKKESDIKEDNFHQESAKCEEEDGSMSSNLESSISKEQDTESIKTETGSMFSSDHRSTTCSASSACSSSSASSSSSSSSSSASSNTSSESSDSSIAKAFFGTPNLGSSTPKRIGSPKSYTPVENLYDSWRLDTTAKTESNTPPVNTNSTVQKQNKCSGYYAEISDYMSIAAPGSSKTLSADNQATVLPPPLEFCNSIRKVKEQALYMNLPTHKAGISSFQTSKNSLREQQMDEVIVNDYVDPQDELADEPKDYKKGVLSTNSKMKDHSRNSASNPYETPLDLGTAATQTDLEVGTLSCDCGEFSSSLAEMEELVSQLKQEQNMRKVSEQLVKMVEVEVKELKEDLLAKKTDLVRALEEKQNTQGELRETTKIAAQYKLQVDELEKSLAQSKTEISKLEETLAVAGSPESGRTKEERSDLDFDKKIAEAKDTEAKNRLEVVQTELLASKDEVNRLLSHLAQATREKADMVSSKVHKELLRMAEERASRAEMKTLALQRELGILMEERYLSTGEPPKIPPRRSEVKYPASSVGIRTSPKYFQKHNTLYSRGNIGAKRGQPAAGGRSPGGAAAGNKRAKTQNRTWSLKNVEAGKAMKEAKKEENKEVKTTGKVSFLQRVQSRVSSAQSKSEVQKSLFNRMQSRFFARSKSPVPPSSSSCDLPDLSSLEDDCSKSEYEIPMDPVQRFTGTPRIIGDESADESDWSSEEEGSTSKRPRNDGGHRKARRNRSRKGRKEKDAKSDEKHKSNKSLDDKQETMATPAPSAPVSRLAEVLSSKEGLKSAALKSTARDQANANETGAKVSDEVKKGNSDSTTIIKIKPPPPTAPKPRAKRTSSSQSSEGTEEKSREAKTKPASETPKVVTTSYGPVEDSIFDGLEIKPKLTSYKRTMGPQGRRLPQRYSNQVQSQRFSNQSNNSLAVVSA